MALMLFVVGAIEYLLAAWWTHVVVSRRVGSTAVVTFVNVLLWGFVITRLDAGNPALLVAHGVGCALGAAAGCWIPDMGPQKVRRFRRHARPPAPARPREAEAG